MTRKKLEEVLLMSPRELLTYGKLLDKQIERLSREADSVVGYMTQTEKYQFMRVFYLVKIEYTRLTIFLVGANAELQKLLRGYQIELVMLRSAYYNGMPAGRA